MTELSDTLDAYDADLSRADSMDKLRRIGRTWRGRYLGSEEFRAVEAAHAQRVLRAETEELVKQREARKPVDPGPPPDAQPEVPLPTEEELAAAVDAMTDDLAEARGQLEEAAKDVPQD